jgi:hypothetical protein
MLMSNLEIDFDIRLGGGGGKRFGPEKQPEVCRKALMKIEVILTREGAS